MLNGKVDDARDILFADPTDTLDSPESLQTLSLDDQIDYAEWQVRVAKAHVEDLKRQKAELDAHIEAEYQEHLDREYGRIACESDKADAAVADTDPIPF